MRKERRGKDHRAPLTIAAATWDREDDSGRSRLLREAAKAGLRLIVVSRDGTEWAPPADPEAW
ncbi:MAG: hypothetical protein U1C74_19630 [Phenylobacterium sp.]|nr:hypothetical protein [Phenylobacterium sp.]